MSDDRIAELEKENAELKLQLERVNQHLDAALNVNGHIQQIQHDILIIKNRIPQQSTNSGNLPQKNTRRERNTMMDHMGRQF